MLQRKPFARKLPPPRPAKQWTADERPGPRVPLPALAEIPMACEPIEKDDPTRDEGYRRLVATLPCSHCGIVGFSQAAHGPTLGARIKASDDSTFPLCCDRLGVKGCHARFDQYELFDAPTRVLMAAVWAGRARAQLAGAT